MVEQKAILRSGRVCRFVPLKAASRKVDGWELIVEGKAKSQGIDEVIPSTRRII
jgi:hypothetical protein